MVFGDIVANERSQWSMVGQVKNYLPAALRRTVFSRLP